MNPGPLFSSSVSLTDCDPVDERDTSLISFSFMKAMNTLGTENEYLFFNEKGSIAVILCLGL